MMLIKFSQMILIITFVLSGCNPLHNLATALDWRLNQGCA